MPCTGCSSRCPKTESAREALPPQKETLIGRVPAVPLPSSVCVFLMLPLLLVLLLLYVLRLFSRFAVFIVFTHHHILHTPLKPEVDKRSDAGGGDNIEGDKNSTTAAIFTARGSRT